MQRVLESRPGSREPQRARLELLRIQSRAENDYEDLLLACAQYWQDFQQKAFCFDDVKAAISAIDPSSMLEVLEKLKGPPGPDENQSKISGSMVAVLNELRFRYCFTVPIGENTDQLQEFAAEALSTFRASLETSAPGPEAALLAAMAMVRLAYSKPPAAYALPQSAPYLLQASLILEACRLRATDYYPASLLSLRIGSLLGMVSLVMRDFKGLSIKNVQWETTGHLLLTRISTTHPHRFGPTSPPGVEDTSPSRALDSALAISTAFQSTINSQIRSGLKHSSYANIAESVGLKRDLELSLSRQLFLIEEARINWLLSKPQRFEHRSRPVISVDKRDSCQVPVYVSNTAPNIWSYLECGPLPSDTWLDALALHDCIMHILQSQNNDAPSDCTGLASALRNMKADSVVVVVAKSRAAGITQTELDNLNAHISIANIILGSVSVEPVPEVEVSSGMQLLKNWLQSQLRYTVPGDDTSAHNDGQNEFVAFSTSLVGPSWLYLHRSYSVLETLRAISILITVARRKTKGKKNIFHKLSHQDLLELERLVDWVENSVHENTRRLRQMINAPGMLGKLIDIGLGRNDQDELGPVGKQIELLIDPASLETYCGMMRDSWEEALDGILAVKAKPDK